MLDFGSLEMIFVENYFFLENYMFLTIFYTVNLSPLLTIKQGFKAIIILSNYIQ